MCDQSPLQLQETKVQPVVSPSPSSVPDSYAPLKSLVTPPGLALSLCQESHRLKKALLPRVSPSAQVQSTWTGLLRGPLAPTEEPLSPQLPTLPPPTLWLAAEEAAAGCTQGPESCSQGLYGKLQPPPPRALKTKLFVFPIAICGQGAHPPPHGPGSEVGTEQKSELWLSSRQPDQTNS